MEVDLQLNKTVLYINRSVQLKNTKMFPDGARQ